MISSTQVNKFQTTPYHFINNFFSSNRFLPPNRNCFGFNAAYDGHSTSRNVHIQPIKITVYISTTFIQIVYYYHNSN